MDDQEIVVLGRQVADKDLGDAVNTENAGMIPYGTIRSVKVGASVMANFVMVILSTV